MRAALVAILLAVGGVAADQQTNTNPYASTYQPAPSQTNTAWAPGATWRRLL